VVWESLPPTLNAVELESSSDRLCLVIVSDSGVLTLPIPAQGELTVGRSDESDVVVDDPLISRQHLILRMQESITVEDLGSANGSSVRGERLVPGRRVPLAIGQVVDLGSSMLIVQPARGGGEKRRRLASHTYFEVRLEEACGRKRTAFAVMRLSIDGEDTAAIQAALTHVVRPNDVIASYAPGEYELLLLDTAKSRAEKIAGEVKSDLEARDLSVRIGIASHPADGATPDALMSAASADLRGHARTAGGESLVIADGAMKDLFRVLQRIAQGSISVLLLGETGVGKEVIAEQLHLSSPRKQCPFVRFSCAALSETIVESELFGYEKGAFSGADQAKIGLLESADGGSVFLDEVGELTAGTQAKLLRALEQREVLPVGGVRPRPIDVRFIAATNRDLDAEVEAGRFRSDLYYRLNGITVRVPPLRERVQEIEPLAELFVEKAAEDLGIADPPVLSERAIELLESYSWPGNIRELKNVMERAMLLCTSPEIGPESLPLDKLSATWTSQKKPRGGEDHQKRILDALEACAGNQTRAAEVLGISRRTLTKWLDRYALPRPRKLK
jgi:DNA-binding NtrC family response regulator/pSer/pThr/pTyr-binding forkhead associated (FHA) protein